MKLKNLINRIPRPVKACTCALIALILVMVLYIVWGCPTLTMKQDFRRAEKVHMVGPSEIVDIVYEDDYYEFGKLFVGETEHGISFFGKYYTTSSERGLFADSKYLFNYIPKTGEITVAPAPNVYGTFWDMRGAATLPVYVFTENKDAVRAEIRFTISSEHRNPDPNYSYSINYSVTMEAEASKSTNGMFRFLVKASNNSECDALSRLSGIISNNSISFPQTGETIPVIVRLYDANDVLIVEETIVLGTETQ